MSESDSATRSDANESEPPLLEAVELTTGPEPTATVIWLHGLGADGHDFEPVEPILGWPGAPAIRFVFPHAPVRSVTINSGMRMRAWYDIFNTASGGFGHDQSDIAESLAQVTALIEREQRRGIAPRRVVLAGFSQGGAIALQLALRYPHRLAGLIALSTYLLHADRIRAEAPPDSATNLELPVFMGHGTMDPLVPVALGESAAQTLRALGYQVEWHAYPQEHTVGAEEIDDIRHWLRRQLT